MNPLCGLQIALQPRLFLRQLFIKPGVFQRNGKICRENGKCLYVVFSEIIRDRALQVEHANNSSLVHHRNRQFGPRLRIHHDIARIHRNIGHQYWLLQGRRRAYEAFAHPCSQLALHALSVLHVHAMPEHFLFLVIQHDAQNLIINHPFGLFRGTP